MELTFFIGLTLHLLLDSLVDIEDASSVNIDWTDSEKSKEALDPQ